MTLLLVLRQVLHNWEHSTSSEENCLGGVKCKEVEQET